MINQEKTLELVDRSQRKDTAAFAQLVTEFQPMVFRLAFRLLCDEDEARDITQETFVKVWLSLKTIIGRIAFLPGFIKSPATRVMTVYVHFAIRL